MGIYQGQDLVLQVLGMPVLLMVYQFKDYGKPKAELSTLMHYTLNTRI